MINVIIYIYGLLINHEEHVNKTTFTIGFSFSIEILKGAFSPKIHNYRKNLGLAIICHTICQIFQQSKVQLFLWYKEGTIDLSPVISPLCACFVF